MLNPLQLVSLSDFVLSLFCLFLSGILFRDIQNHLSRYGMLCYFLLVAGLAAFMGGVDHGFFEPIHQRYYPRTFTYIFIAAGTFCLFRYSLLTFFKGKVQQLLSIIAYIQLITFVISSFYYHHFLLVVCNYAPILMLFFAMNLLHVKKGKSEFNFTLFCLIMTIATLIQVLEISISENINGDTLFHIIAFFGYIFFFIGAQKKSTVSAST